MVDGAQKDWKAFEQLVADIQRDLAPGAKVTHDVSMYGYDSETNRQIDVLVEQQIGQFHVNIIFDCKDHATPVDVKGLEAFVSMVRDVRAHQGCMVSAKGFTVSARKLAKRHAIAIYSLVDTADHKWQAKVSLPVLCEFRGAALSFRIACSAPMPFRIQNGFLDNMMVKDEAGNDLGTCVGTAIARWNNGELPFEVGQHGDLPIFPVNTFVDNGYGAQTPVKLTVSLLVKGTRYFGMLPVSEMRGLRDEQTGGVITNAFKANLISPTEMENQWHRLNDGEDPPRPVAIRIMGLECWEIEGQRLR